MSAPKTKKILVIEDDKFIRDGIYELLEIESYEVLLAENGQRGLELLQKSLVDLILLDLAMPVMDGYAFRAEQVKRADFAKIPVVVMTADGHAESKKKAIGAQGHLRKPFDMEDLYRVIKDCL